jgi:hypothetical protein
MRCPAVLRKLEGLIAGTLAPRARAILDEHLRACPACSAELRRARLVWDALETPEPPGVTAEFSRRLWASIDAEERAHPARAAARYAPTLALAGATVFAIALGLAAGHEMTRTRTSAVEPPVAEWPVAALDRVPTGSVGGVYEDLLTGGGT